MADRTYSWKDMNERMPPPVEDQYRELLCPIKDPEKSFAVNISELLASYVDNFRKGNVPPNFNSAALLLQGSSSIYGKKVEFLYNLALTLHDNLLKNKKGEDPRKKDPKEKAPRQAKLVDPFCSTEIKPGKNLSCLHRRNTIKKAAAGKKSQKKVADKIYSFVPVDLLPLEGEEKGDVFYDTHGEPIGNKGDYALNKCRVTSSGWLLLLTVSADLVSDLSITSDYSAQIVDDDNRCDSDVDIFDVPADEGYPASSGCPSSPPTAPGSQVASSQQTDEGLGSLQSTPSAGPLQLVDGPSLPNDGSSQPVEGMEVIVNADMPMEDMEVAGEAIGHENIPLEGVAGEEVLGAIPIRRSIRQALRTRQLNPEQDGTNVQQNGEVNPLIKAIQKNNTCHLPSKLRNVNDENAPLQPCVPASVFCARTFFSLDRRLQRSDMISLKVTAFANNSKFISQISKYKDAIRTAKIKRKASGEEFEDDIEVEGVEELKEADADCDPPNPGLEYDDIQIHRSPTHSIGGDERPFADDIPLGDVLDDEVGVANGIQPEPFADVEAEFARLAEEQMAVFRDDLVNYEQTSEMNARVRSWQQGLVPFLREINLREKFDINLYGSRILNAFDDSNRRQTIAFRDFCKGMEKWQIHRYFMALLPLANIGNVHLENEPRDDGDDDDTLITLLSRKMHHLELEEFGHNAGEHS